MSPHPTPEDRTGPLQEIQEAGARALALLDDPDAPPLEAVIWLSAHLSAVQHVLHPAVAGVLHDESAVAALRRSTARTEGALRLLEQSLSGDALVPDLDRGGTRASLVAATTAQTRDEQLLLDQLAEQLTQEQQHELVADYRRALEHAPTRPHPHSPHGAVLGGLAFRVNGWRDRVMDAMDGRAVPSPRPLRPPPVHSRWGDYLLGSGSRRTLQQEPPPPS